MEYDFDSVVDRNNTNSIKWDFTEQSFGSKDILPMWIADMDFRSPQPVIDAIKRVAEHGIFGYTGVPESYFNACIRWMKKRHNWDIKKRWIVLSPGVIPALHVLVKAFTNPGDQVVVQTPVYYPFFTAIKSNGCEILENPLRLENGQYYMDIADLAGKINSRTKMVILCNPHNPVSRVWQENELKELGELCIKNKILVVSDEIHEDIVYSGFKHIPYYSISDRLADYSVICTGVSKTFNLPGLQMANIIIKNPKLRNRFTKALEVAGIFLPNLFGITATEAAYQYGEEWLDQMLVYLEGNVKFLTEYISTRIPGLMVAQPQGTYLLWLDFHGCKIDPSMLGRFVREEAKVGLEAGTIFGCKEDGFERMNIACPRTTLAEGLNRIEKAVNSLRN